MLVLAGAAPAAATTSSADAVGGLRILCDGSCQLADLGGVPEPAAAFDFGLGLALVTDDADLTLRTTRSIYLLGPTNVEGLLSLDASTIGVWVPPFEGPLLPPPGSGFDAGAGVQSVIARPVPDISVGASLLIEVDVDVYLDVRDRTLATLTLVAGEQILIMGVPLAFVPEPGTATLVGLGLASLAAARGRRPV